MITTRVVWSARPNQPLPGGTEVVGEAFRTSRGNQHRERHEVCSQITIRSLANSGRNATPSSGYGNHTFIVSTTPRWKLHAAPAHSQARRRPASASGAP